MPTSDRARDRATPGRRAILLFWILATVAYCSFAAARWRSGGPTDFYLLWSVGQALRELPVENVYTEPDRSAITAELRIVMREPPRPLVQLSEPVAQVEFIVRRDAPARLGELLEQPVFGGLQVCLGDLAPPLRLSGALCQHEPDKPNHPGRERPRRVV